MSLTALFRYFKPYVPYILLVTVLLFGQASCDLALPDLMSDIVNDGITAGNASCTVETGLKTPGVALIGAACTVTVGFLDARVAAGASRGLCRDVFTAVESFSNAEMDHSSTSSPITRTTNDITQIQMLIVMMIRMVFYASIMAVGGILHALAKDKSMSWIIALAVFLLSIVVFSMFSLVMPRLQLVQKLIDRLNLVVRENLEGMLVIRTFDTQKSEENRFDRVNRRLTQISLFVNRIMFGMMPAMMLIMNLTTVLVVQVGSNQAFGFHMEVGDMTAYVQYVMRIIMVFLMMSMMFIMIPRAIVSINRVVEILTTRSSVTGEEHPITLSQSCKGAVEYCHVSPRHPSGNEDVLTDINFTVCPGQVIAFIGVTGSGKSTLVNLLPRPYDATRGEALIDGISIEDWPPHDLRRNLGFVPQEGIPFSGTIRSNLACGDKDAGEEQIPRAVGITQAIEFIESKPNLLDTLIAQGGGNVFGGQKQRLTIARALVKNVPINVFDDSFSVLDLKTDVRLRAALEEETGNSTQFLVAQGISTTMSVDQAIVLDHGRVVGRGTHRELMKGCIVYREIALSQLSEKELQ